MAKGSKKPGKKAKKKVVKKAAKPAGAAKKKRTKTSFATKARASKKTAKKAVKKTSAKKRPAKASPKKPPVKSAKPTKVKAAGKGGTPARITNSFYITTAIAYPNGVPHIGHAYEAIATDALARFQRLDGKDVFFLTGTDEHGQKMIQTAQKEGMTPLDLATRNAQRFVDMDRRLNVSLRPLHPHLRAGTSRVVASDLGADGEERRHLSRHLCRLVFGAR